MKPTNVKEGNKDVKNYADSSRTLNNLSIFAHTLCLNCDVEVNNCCISRSVKSQNVNKKYSRETFVGLYNLPLI